MKLREDIHCLIRQAGIAGFVVVVEEASYWLYGKVQNLGAAAKFRPIFTIFLDEDLGIFRSRFGIEFRSEVENFAKTRIAPRRHCNSTSDCF